MEQFSTTVCNSERKYIKCGTVKTEISEIYVS